jgi:hypothetical protein
MYYIYFNFIHFCGTVHQFGILGVQINVGFDYQSSTLLGGAK